MAMLPVPPTWTSSLPLAITACALGAATAIVASPPVPLPTRLPSGDYRPREPRSIELPHDDGGRQRKDAVLARARVWNEPATPIESASLGSNRPDLPDELVCRYKPEPTSGTTPKFDCVLAGGEVVKIKYGATTEIPAEIAATRLLAALGFGADTIYLIRKVRCFGCPRSPFRAMQLA
jgi:hypothetical protein